MRAVAVLLLLGSVAVLKIAADSSAELQAGIAAKDKHDYEKHGHGKKHDDYKPDGYKPDAYGYKEYKSGYGKDHKPGYGSYEPDRYYGEQPYDYHSYGEHYEGYEAPYGSYGENNPYDGGYWGGFRGRQIIHLQTLYPEDLINTTLVDRSGSIPPFGDDTCEEDTYLSSCKSDFAVLCAWRHHEDKPSYGGYGDYATGKYGPIFRTEPTVPVAIGKGYWTLDPDTTDPFFSLVTFNGHQRGYKFGTVSGFIKNFAPAASQCHPLLGPNTVVKFNEARVPVYLIFGKVKLPVDPAILLPLAGYPYANLRNKQPTKAEIMGDKTTDYKTTPEGNKYTVHGDTAYVSTKDNTLCGLSLVARGPATLTVTGTDLETTTYTGTIEWPIVWTDLITTLPLLVTDQVDRRVAGGGGGGGSGLGALFGPAIGEIVEIYLEKTLDRVASICESNSDVPWITPGAITLNVAPSP